MVRVNGILEQHGMAMVLVLVIVVISAGLLGAVMYFSLTGTEISGVQRKYQTSKEASIGAIDIFTKELLPQVITGQGTITLSGIAAGLNSVPDIVNSVVASATNDACVNSKLTTKTADWSGCGGSATTTNANQNPDITFNLLSVAGGKPYEVNLKIIDTVEGNSSNSPVNLGGSSGVVPAMQATKAIQHHPYFFTVVTESKVQGSNSTAERANFEVLYAY